MAANLTIRRATKEDYSGVLNMGTVYEDRDYLPAIYDKILKWYNCYVAEINGEIIGFNGDRLVDGGMTLTTAASRVKESHQGQGILAAMLKRVYESYRDVSTLKYETMTTNNLNDQMNGHKFRKRYQQILEQPFHEYTVNVKDLRPESLELEPDSSIVKLGAEGLESLFKSTEMCSHLFPEGRLVTNWYPFRLLKENIPMMIEEREFYATKHVIITTVSTSEWYSLNTTFTYKLDLFGANTSEIRCHIIHHIQNLSKLVDSEKYATIVVHVCYPSENVNSDLMSSFWEPSGFKRSIFNIDKLLLFERDI